MDQKINNEVDNELYPFFSEEDESWESELSFDSRREEPNSCQYLKDHTTKNFLIGRSK